MFEKKKLWMALAAATMVAACGGSDGGGTIGDSSGDGGGSGGDNPGGGGTTPFEETTLQGNLEMDSNQLIMDQLLQLSDYQGGGIFGQSQGDTGAPFSTFGLRLDDMVQGDVGEEGATGRLAIRLAEQAETVDETAGEVAELVEIMVTGVTLQADEVGVLSASVADGATMYVYGRTATGEIVDNIAVDVPAGVISVVPIADAPGGSAAPDSDDVGLLFDLDAAFDAAEGDNATALAQLVPLSGRFDMNFALSAANIHLAGSEEALADQSIGVTNNDLEPVVGSGAPGNIWIGVQPPAAE
jgi:hypothetical protein